MDERFRRAPVGILEATPEGAVTAINQAACDLLETDAETVEGEPIEAVFPHSVDQFVPNAFAGDGPVEGEAEEYYPELDRWIGVALMRIDETVTVYLRDRTRMRERERRTQQLRDELKRQAVLNGLISEVLAELVEASGRQEIAETVCERLGETDIYEFAWFGERGVGGDDIAIRASAGTTGRTLEEVRANLDAAAETPEQRAVETGTPQIVQPIAQSEAVPESIQRAAFADGLQSLLAIPLTYGSSVYGVVGVYAADLDAFSEREQASFATVGEIAGFAVNAARQRSLLLSDTVVELTLQVSDHDDPLVAAAIEADAELLVEGLVPQGDEELLAYLTVEGAPPARLESVLAETEGATLSRIVEVQSESGTVELRLDARTALGTLSAHGAAVREAKFGPRRGRMEVELPPDEEIRRIATAVTRRFDAEIVAKRQRQRDVTTAREFRDELREELTDRQETVLRTAFLADYFESPRGSTAEEVAQALDITGPTLLYHLRSGQRKLLEQFFETSNLPPADDES